MQKQCKGDIDSREPAAISLVDQNWVAEDWYPRSLETGLKYSAVVVPIKTIAKFSLNRLVSGLELSNPSQEFDDINEAFQWLLTVK